jgi:hypothetical protein
LNFPPQSLRAYAVQEDLASNEYHFNPIAQRVSAQVLSSASDRLTGNQNSMDSRSPAPGLADLRVEGTGDDSDLIALGKQFEEIAAKLQELYDPASPNDHLKLIEATVCTENPVRVDDVTESPKLAQ